MVTTTNETMFMTINSAAALTGLSRSYIRRGCIAGTVPHIKCGQKYMVCVPRLMEQLAAEAGGAERE